MRAVETLLRDRRLVCENERYNIFFDDVEDSQGRRVKDYLVVAPKCRTGDLVTGVAALPIRGASIGLVKVHRHAIGRALWEVPRGFIDSGETSAESGAARELLEETGLRPGRIISLGYLSPEPGVLAARVGLFAVIVDEGETPGPTSDELGHETFRFFERHEIDRLLRRSEIEDPSTLCCIYRARDELG